MSEEYFYGQGKVKLAIITAGVTGKWFWAGDVSALSLAFSEEKASHKESYTGLKGTVREFNIENTLNVSATFHDFNADNIAMFTRGTTATAVGGTVTGEDLGTVVAGEEVALANPGVSSVVVTDSLGSPATIDPGHYTVDTKFGNILFETLPDSPAPTMPLIAAYSYLATEQVAFLSDTQKQIALRYEGINLAEGGRAEIVELYNVSPGLLSELSLITDGGDLAEMSVEGAVLLDSRKVAGGSLGQYGRILRVTE